MGLISITNIADGTVIDANDVNSPLNTIVNEINGNLSEANLANGAVTTSKIADTTITNAKIANSTIDWSKLAHSSVPKVLKVSFNNGTVTRSNAPVGVGNIAAIPGATGDTSFTAPYNCDILFTITTMVNNTNTGSCRVYLSINGASYGPGLYFDVINLWQVQTCTHKYSVNSGDTITIGARWWTSAGTATITNNNTDSDYPNSITGLVIPRL